MLLKPGYLSGRQLLKLVLRVKLGQSFTIYRRIIMIHQLLSQESVALSDKDREPCNREERKQ